MDHVRAARMAEELKGVHIGGWLVREYKGAGKSAVVFEGEKDGLRSALKVFDPELVQKYRKNTQQGRIKRELRVKGDEHPNLVQIFDGGECSDTGHLYVAMEFIDAPNLEDCLSLVPREKIRPIIQQIASAAHFLETRGLIHRDIKPANIVILPDFSRAVLLDLGVLRPVGDPNLTDEDAKCFVGTLRYSSPEFLFREEIDTEEGWRAVTFYQLGAVLHDLIMRRPLFTEYSDPFARLVEAVKIERPQIVADDVTADLILLAQNCLLKDYEARLKLVAWKDFEEKRSPGSSMSARERVQRRLRTAVAQPATVATPSALPPQQIRRSIESRIADIIRGEFIGNSLPPLQVIPGTDDPVRIKAVFDSSPAHSLPTQLSICFHCTAIGEATVALSVDACACMSTTGNPACEAPAPANIFKGPLDSDHLPQQVHEAIWHAIDQAQTQVWSGSGNDVQRLNLGEKENS